MAITAAALIGGSSALSAGSSLIGSGKSASASKSAAQYSYYSTMAAIDAEENQYSDTEQMLRPYRSAGYDVLGSMANMANTPWGTDYYTQAGNQYNAAVGYQNEAQNYLTQAAGMNPNAVLSQQNLEQTPGYQFTMQQGLKQTQAAAAARGLGVSGASLKGAATYATGLADATYSNRFNEAQQSWQDVMNQAQGALNIGTNAQNTGAGYLNTGSAWQNAQKQQYNEYANIANLGENAAASTGQAGTTTSGQEAQSYSTGSQQYGNYLSQSGQAQAAGTTGASSALTSGVNNYLTYSALQNAGLFGTSTTSGLQDQLNSSFNNVTLPYTQGNTYSG